ncbi:MAG: gliding motility lipoprotein GldD [Bacteroidales bacterium]|nr:gliding motility lipoprotein GldD [Bacteroidales bacterium]
MKNKLFPKKKYLLISSVITFLFFLSACENNYYPKPKGFFRIDLPEKEYKMFDSLPFPYSFEIPDYAVIYPDTDSFAEPFWLNMYFPVFNASMHFSYKHVNNNLNVFIDDAHLFVSKHIPKANLINERKYINPESRVYGLLFDIEGSGAASPLQFYLTDSTAHFVRGALYFNFLPNNDSLEPVIDYISADIQHLIETFHWREE